MRGCRRSLGRVARIAGLRGRISGRAGCSGGEHDYTAFEKDLTPLLQRAHEGQGHHVGKSPMRGKGGAAVEVEKTLADGVIHGEPVEPRKKKVVDVGQVEEGVGRRRLRRGGL